MLAIVPASTLNVNVLNEIVFVENNVMAVVVAVPLEIVPATNDVKTNPVLPNMF
jgi:hypothetical protein